MSAVEQLEISSPDASDAVMLPERLQEATRQVRENSARIVARITELGGFSTKNAIQAHLEHSQALRGHDNGRD